MESLYFLIPLSLVVVAFGVAIFFWAVKSGQYDDLDGDAERILFDDIDSTDKTGSADKTVSPAPPPDDVKSTGESDD